MNVLGTGLSGLVGSRIVDILAKRHVFTNLSLDTGVDITNKKEVTERIHASDAPCVLHFAAVTDVDGIEKERSLGESSLAWRVNVAATHSVVDACVASHKRLLYISTDYVFDGTKEAYTEEDIPNPKSWYAYTKYEGEKIVSSAETLGAIFRIANPYRASQIEKKDFIEKMRMRLVKGETITAPNDQLLVPTYIDDIAAAVDLWLSSAMSGVYHVVGSDAFSPYDVGITLAKEFGYNMSLVQATSYAVYFNNRASRPLRAVLKNDKITRLGITPLGLVQGLQKIKEYQRTTNI